MSMVKGLFKPFTRVRPGFFSPCLRGVFVLLAFSFCFFAGDVKANELVIGTPHFSEEINWLRSEHPAAWLVRRAVMGFLVEPKGRGGESASGFKLSLARSVSAERGQAAWRVRVSPAAIFSSGKRVKASDVVFSFHRCQEEGLLRGLSEVQRIDGGQGEEEVLLALEEGLSPLDRDLFPRSLAACPLLEQGSMELFGLDSGFGTNIVSAGPYVLVEFSAGRQLRLRARDAARSGAGRGRDITLRSFDQAERGLTAIRMGALDLFFTEDGDVLAKAEDDETLRVLQCEGSSVIARQGLRVDCQPWLGLTRIRYGASL